MLYYQESDLTALFDTVYSYYAKIEEVPKYQDYQEGVSKLFGIFEGVKSDFYPTIQEKAAYLFIQINKGHFFSNGNKRLALVSTATFLEINNYRLKMLDNAQYEAKIREVFSAVKTVQDFPEFHPEEFALYNLSLIVADSHKYVNDFDELKRSVVNFFEFALTEK